MNHLMLDIETLGVSADAPLISIGAVFFDPLTGKQGAEFYKTINIVSALNNGEIDPLTLQWWMMQSDEARSVFSDPASINLENALLEFADFIKANGSEDLSVWGNGSSFDNAILSGIYRKKSLRLPWDFRNDRDVRTIVALAKDLRNFDARGSISISDYAHHALHDARYQAAYVSAAFKAIYGIK